MTSPATGGLAGQVALVTGGGRGIGRAVARAFAAEGAAVAVAARTPADVEAVAAECGEIARRHAVAAAGSEVARAYAVDLTDEAVGTDVIRRVEKDLGPLDILVNNAGLAVSGKFVDTTTESWRKVMALDLDAPFFLTRAALPTMLARSRGAVINIASVAARAGFPYVAAYTAAKHGLLGLTRALAAEYAASGLTFNCVCPFYVDTPMTEETVDNIVRKTGRSRQEALAPLLTPQGRLVEPDEVAAVCVLLASDAGRSINGQAINVDGGRHQG